MFDEQILRKVIGKLMVQVEEERRRRVEAIRALTNLPLFEPFSIKRPTEEDIERRIVELSQV